MKSATTQLIFLVGTIVIANCNSRIGCNLDQYYRCVLSSDNATDFKNETIFHKNKLQIIYNVKLENLNTKYLPTIFETFKEINELIIEDCGVLEIGQSSFRGALKMRILIIHNNLYQNMTDYSFINAENLEELNLKSNQISEISTKAFWGLEKLKQLNIANNSIEILSQKIFEGIQNLKILIMDHNRIKILNFELFAKNIQLEELSIAHNEISLLNQTGLENLLNLRNLNLRGNLCVDRAFLDGFSDFDEATAGCVWKENATEIVLEVETSSGSEKEIMVFVFIGIVFIVFLLNFSVLMRKPKENEAPRPIQITRPEEETVKDHILHKYPQKFCYLLTEQEQKS